MTHLVRLILLDVILKVMIQLFLITLCDAIPLVTSRRQHVAEAVAVPEAGSKQRNASMQPGVGAQGVP